MTFADRVTHLAPEGAYLMLARAQALEARAATSSTSKIGQPDVPTFENISTAGIKAIEDGFTRYTAPAGMPALRKAIAEDAGRRRGMSFSPSQVVVGPGAKPALFFPTLALVRPGDEVIYPDPGFPTYAAMIGVAGGKARARAAVRGTGLLVRPRRVRPAGVRPHAADHPQLAQQPDRRRHAARRAGAHRQPSRSSATSGCSRTRSTCASRSTVCEVPTIAALPGHGRAHDHLRRLLQDLRDDRLAAGLRHHA